MAALFDTILRGLLFFFLIIALALTAALIEQSDQQNSQINFGLFSAIFGILFGVFYGLGVAFIESLAFPIVIAVIDFLDFIFLFAGATSIASGIGAHSCTNKSYLKSNDITQSSEHRCREAQAAVAFLYFGTFTTIALMVYTITNVFSSGAFSLPSRRSSPPRTGIPTMSQV